MHCAVSPRGARSWNGRDHSGYPSLIRAMAGEGRRMLRCVISLRDRAYGFPSPGKPVRIAVFVFALTPLLRSAVAV